MIQQIKKGSIVKGQYLIHPIGRLSSSVNFRKFVGTVSKKTKGFLEILSYVPSDEINEKNQKQWLKIKMKKAKGRFWVVNILGSKIKHTGMITKVENAK